MSIRFVFHAVVVSTFVVLGAGSIAPAQESDDPTSSIEPTQSNIEGWRDHILPTEAELAWQKIDWLPNLQSGIAEAAKSQRPILLWAMNGHPFGCT